MKTLFVCPEIRLDSNPSTITFWAGILAAIAEKKGGDVAILDLNAIRMNYGGGYSFYLEKCNFQIVFLNIVIKFHY